MPYASLFSAVRVEMMWNVFDGVMQRRELSKQVSGWSRVSLWVIRPLTRVWHLAEAHELNPWVFVIMSVLGYLVQTMVFLPPFQSQGWKLAFLIVLRLIALVVPCYILSRGKRIAMAFNASVVAMFLFNTAWHVCYYVYG